MTPFVNAGGFGGTMGAGWRITGGMGEQKLGSYTCALDAAQGDALEAYVREHGFEMREVPYARFAGKLERVNVVFYESGKLVVQGRGTREFVEFVLEPEILKEARLGYEAELEPGLTVARIGVDESGKGDFFGPLCIAGVYVNEGVCRVLVEAGVRDSKRVSSDRRIAALAKVIREAPGCVWSVVPVGPDAYNRLYGKMRNVNRLLAWGHARVIENLLEKGGEMDPAPVRAISDQFASTKATVEKALLARGRELELVQRHKAESDMAVAAASILARHEFVTRLADLSEEMEVELPRGAGKLVDVAAKVLVEKYGEVGLEQACKLHFRNAPRALGRPEPPRVEWRKKRGGG